MAIVNVSGINFVNVLSTIRYFEVEEYSSSFAKLTNFNHEIRVWGTFGINSNNSLTNGIVNRIEVFTSGQFVGSIDGISTNLADVAYEIQMGFHPFLDGDDSVYGSDLSDRIYSGLGSDVIFAGGGNDTISTSVNTSQMLENDTVFGGSGHDVIRVGRSGYVRGEDGNDSIEGSDEFDDLHGNAGDDSLNGGKGDDWVVGGKGNDLLIGAEGRDIVYGNLGNDTCYGGAKTSVGGGDLIRGGKGNDVLYGGPGDDWISGDRDADTLSGGAGSDIFHTFGDAGIDMVLDFSRAEGDRVQLEKGTAYTVAQVGADVAINMVGGAQMVLVGVDIGSLTGDWIFAV